MIEADFLATRRRFPIGCRVYPVDLADNRTGVVLGYGLLPWSLVVDAQRPGGRDRETITDARIWKPWHENVPF